MIFIETSIFTRLVISLLSDEEYRELQVALIEDPNKGPVIPGSGGLRKLRWAVPGRGKSGGVRVIYYLITQNRVLFVYIYAKAEQGNLSPEQLKRLRNLIEGER